MSLGSLGIIGGLAASTAAQRGAEIDKTARESADLAKTADSVTRTQQAAGVGQTDEFSESTDRDADGRQLWQRREQKPENPAELTSIADPLPLLAPTHLPKDPHGEAGSLLDLEG